MKMSFVNTLYRAVFRRTSTLALAVVVGVFFFERAFDQSTDMIFKNLNRGKLYEDVKHKFVKKEEEEE